MNRTRNNYPVTGLGIIILILLLAIGGCNTPDKDRTPIARFDDSYLYLDELQDAIPNAAIEADSVFAAQNFINNWINQQLILSQAERYLKDKDLDFDKQLEEYRNSLIIFSYQEELVKQKLDTSVTDDDIRAYYDSNHEDFVLKDNILKVIYVKLVHDETELNKFRRLIKSDENSKRLELAELCKLYAVNYYLDDESWLFFDDLLKEINIKTYNQEAFLENNRYVEFKDSLYQYLMYIKGFRIKEGYSPISLERSRIVSIILNKRRTEIISNMIHDVYDKAEKKKRFEIYQ